MTTVQRMVAIGECMIELVHASERELVLGIAGDTFNTAVYFKRSSMIPVDVTYLTAIGIDAYSELMTKSMANEEVTFVGPRVPERNVGLYFVQTDAEGEREFTYYRAESAATTMFGSEWTDEYNQVIEEADLVYLSAITLQILTPAQRDRLREVLAKAHAQGARLAFDSNLRTSGWSSLEEARSEIRATAALCDIVLPTLADEQILNQRSDPQSIIAVYRDAGVPEVVVKDGSGPTHLFAGDRHYTVSVPKDIRVVDTTGAGDSFNGAYLAARMTGVDPLESVTAAQQTSAIVVQHRGAIIPIAAAAESMEDRNLGG